MTITSQIAKQFREVHFGGNWTSVNLKDTLADVNWVQATTKLYTFNTIASLVFHVNYYVAAVLPVLHGQPLNAHDRFSFDHPPVESEHDWQELLNKTWNDAENFARRVEQLPDDLLSEKFVGEKYGNYYRHLTGVIEHAHYHLGQIVIIKKIIAEGNM